MSQMKTELLDAKHLDNFLDDKKAANPTKTSLAIKKLFFSLSLRCEAR
jgi:hypothetical protein